MNLPNDRIRASFPLAIIGPGKVGTVLGVLAARAGWTVRAVGGRDIERTSRCAAETSPETRACSPVEAGRSARLILLTVSDDAIELVCQELSQARALAAGSIIAHCCGAMDSSVLASAKETCGSLLVSMHPLQTFPSVRVGIEKIPGTFFFCEGDAEGLEVIEALVRDIGGRPVRMESGGERKALYHAAGVMGCNYLSGLIDASLELMSRCGVQRATALEALSPLIRATVENVQNMGPEAALTGPIARGDIETVRKHLEAIARQPDLADLGNLYRSAGRWTIALAIRKGTITHAQAKEMKDLLDEFER